MALTPALAQNIKLHPLAQKGMKTSEHFRAAKPFLWDGIGKRLPKEGWSICNALYRVDQYETSSWGIRQIIMARLYPSATLHMWLEAKGVPPSHITHERLQAHRHAWLDRLIAEFEIKGD